MLGFNLDISSLPLWAKISITAVIVVIGAIKLYFTIKKTNGQNIEIKPSPEKEKNILELHTKLHDRMNEIISLMKQNQHIDPGLEKRTRMAASRLNAYDETREIKPSVEKILNGWESSLFQFERGYYNAGQLSKELYKQIRLAEAVMTYADNILKKL